MTAQSDTIVVCPVYLHTWLTYSQINPLLLEAKSEAVSDVNDNGAAFSGNGVLNADGKQYM